MKNIRGILVTLICLLCFIINGNSQSISGTWTFNNGNFPLTMLLLDNGTGEFQGLPIKYSIQDSKLIIDDGYQPISYNYQLTQTNLTLSGSGLTMPITFTKSGILSESEPTVKQNLQQANSSSNSSNNGQTNNMNSMAGSKASPTGINSGLNAVWEGQQGKLVFYPDGTMLYNAASYQYTVAGNLINIIANDGGTSFSYNLSNNQLTLSQNNTSTTYTKTSALRPDIIDPQMVGKWCIMSNNYNSYSGGGSSSEECITLNENGTYEYSYSASRSAYTSGQSAYGGTANQNSDRGTWKSDGITIVSVSQTTGKTNRYMLTKENAQNGDATIVLGGKKFVTAYNRPGW
jgi:hypothetical protein